MIENELSSKNRRNRSHIDMPPVGAYRQALGPFRAVNKSVGPFVSDFRSQVRIADLALLNLHVGLRRKWIGNRREALDRRRRNLEQLRSMEPFAVARTQRQLLVNRLPANRELRSLGVELRLPGVYD